LEDETVRRLDREAQSGEALCVTLGKFKDIAMGRYAADVRAIGVAQS